jgi:hypothetical protein
MLWRNFGVTRDGRVVFYDYDEIEYLTAVTFLRIPAPPNPEAELAGEPWYGVGRNDVFPEEFATFLLTDPRLRELFLRHHADLLKPDFWQNCQRRIDGEISTSFRIRSPCGSAIEAEPLDRRLFGRRDSRRVASTTARRRVARPASSSVSSSWNSGMVAPGRGRARDYHQQLLGGRSCRSVRRPSSRRALTRSRSSADRFDAPVLSAA